MITDVQGNPVPVTRLCVADIGRCGLACGMGPVAGCNAVKGKTMIDDEYNCPEIHGLLEQAGVLHRFNVPAVTFEKLKKEFMTDGITKPLFMKCVEIANARRADDEAAAN